MPLKRRCRGDCVAHHLSDTSKAEASIAVSEKTAPIPCASAVDGGAFCWMIQLSWWRPSALCLKPGGSTPSTYEPRCSPMIYHTLYGDPLEIATSIVAAWHRDRRGPYSRRCSA